MLCYCTSLLQTVMFMETVTFNAAEAAKVCRPNSAVGQDT